MFRIQKNPEKKFSFLGVPVSQRCDQPILVQCHISVPPENFRKPMVF